MKPKPRDAKEDLQCRCGNDGTEPHCCLYQCEINNADPEDESCWCTCCDYCTEQCALDISETGP